MDAAKLADTLAAQSLFADCEQAELSDIIRRAHLRTFKPGQELMAQGEEGDTLFIILKGLARVSMVAANGREIILDYAEPGMCWARSRSSTAGNALPASRRSTRPRRCA
jgi:CRP-like cAMP-binding protein